MVVRMSEFVNTWSVDIASLKYDEQSHKRDMTFNEMLEFCMSHGEINKDYEILSAVCVFGDEAVQKKLSVIKILEERIIK